jgi:hypothetical protein
MVDSVQGASSGVRFLYSAARPAAQSASAPADPRAVRRVLTRLERLQVALERIQASETRLPLRRAPSTASAAALGLRYTAPFATLRSTAEINATPTSYTPSNPLFSGASTASPTITGVYDGSQGDTTLTFSALDTAEVGSGDPLAIEVRDGDGNLLETLDFTGAAAGDPVALANGLALTLSAGSVEAGDGFDVAVSSSVGSAVNPSNPFDGLGDAGPGFEAGQSVTAGSFDVNGVSIDVFADDSLLDVLARITASAAGVSASFDALTERVVLTQKTGGATPTIALDNDSSGFLAATKLDGATVSAGRDPEPDEPLANVDAFDGIAAGSFSINGVSIAVDPAVDTLRDVLDRIDAANAGAVAELSTRHDRVTVRASGTTSLVLANGTSGFFTALGIAPGTYESAPEGSSAFTQPARVQAQLEAVTEELNDLLGSGLVPLGNERSATAQTDLAALVREAFGRGVEDTGADALRSRFGLTLESDGDQLELRFERSAFRRSASRDFDGLLDFLLEDPDDGPRGFLPALVEGLEALRRALAEATASSGARGLLVDAAV